MKFTGLFLATLLSLSSVAFGREDVCRIILDKYDKAAMLSRNFIVGSSTRWPNGVVPYVISRAFSKSEARHILHAMRTIEKHTCVKFVRRSGEKRYVKIRTGESGCYANIGYNKHRQVSNLHLQRHSFCMEHRSMTHEMLHILGLNHEQNRPDRNKYVAINWKKVPGGSANNWIRDAGAKENPLPPVCNLNLVGANFDRCYSGMRMTTFGFGYEYASVMHYGLRAGSLDGSAIMRTLQPVPAGVVIGKSPGPTRLDYKKVNIAYPCNTGVPIPEPTRPRKPCEDDSPRCGMNRYRCASDKRVQDQCRKTCKLCEGTTNPPTSSCTDTYSRCKEFISHCHDWIKFKTACKKTCGFC